MFEEEATKYATVSWDKSQDPRYVFVPKIDETKFNDWRNGAEFGYNKAKEEANDIINELLMNGYNENTREKAFNFLYPDKEE